VHGHPLALRDITARMTTVTLVAAAAAPEMAAAVLQRR
jgi:hypothetical protein